jgi:hypothetical protein
MRSCLWTIAAALLGLGAFAGEASAQGYWHQRYHDDLDHREFHRYLLHRDVHRYPMTWGQHERLHDHLDHQRFHDRLEHREVHRTLYPYGGSYYIPNGGFYGPSTGYNPYGGSFYSGYSQPSFGIGVRGRGFSLYFGR